MDEFGAEIIGGHGRARALWLAVGLLLGMVSDAAAQVARFSHPERLGGAFALRESRGEIVTQADLAGRIGLFYFGYTSCPDICPSTLSALSHAVALLKERSDEVAIVFVTVDPARDTPEVLRDYVTMIDPKILALRGELAEVAPMAAAWRADFAFVPIGTDGDYAVDHSSLTYVTDRQGRFVEALVHGSDVELIAAELRRLLGQPSAQ